MGFEGHRGDERKERRVDTMDSGPLWTARSLGRDVPERIASPLSSDSIAVSGAR